MMTKPRLVTPEEMVVILKSERGIDLEVSRIYQLAYNGKIPFTVLDGERWYLDPKKVSDYVEKHLLQHWEPPASISDIPKEIAMVVGSLREIYCHHYLISSGVYFLADHGKVVYVGQSVNLPVRISGHFQDKVFDRIFVLPVPKDELNAVESAFIRRLKPKYNRSHHVRETEVYPWNLTLEDWLAGRANLGLGKI